MLVQVVCMKLNRYMLVHQTGPTTPDIDPTLRGPSSWTLNHGSSCSHSRGKSIFQQISEEGEVMKLWGIKKEVFLSSAAPCQLIITWHLQEKISTGFSCCHSACRRYWAPDVCARSDSVKTHTAVWTVMTQWSSVGTVFILRAVCFLAFCDFCG